MKNCMRRNISLECVQVFIKQTKIVFSVSCWLNGSNGSPFFPLTFFVQRICLLWQISCFMKRNNWANQSQRGHDWSSSCLLHKQQNLNSMSACGLMKRCFRVTADSFSLTYSMCTNTHNHRPTAWISCLIKQKKKNRTSPTKNLE